MSVIQLRRQALADRVLGARRDLAEAAALSPASLPTPALEDVVRELAALESQVAALRLACSAEADARGVAATTAETGTDAWLARLTGEPREVVAGGLWIARELRQRRHHTREALAAGRIRLTQAKVIVRAAAKPPPRVTAEQCDQAEESLVAMATGDGTRSGRPMDARRLRQAARRMFADLLPAEEVDRTEAELLVTEEHRAELETWLMLHDNGDGTFSGRFTIPELHGHLLTQVLDRLSAPRRLGRDRAGRCVVDETAVTTTRAEQLGAGFCELLEHLPTAGHEPSSATLLVTLDLAHLMSGLGAARLDTGVRISAGEARRLACEAGIVPAVLGGRSVPLDLGRSRRLHSRHQRQALALRHDSCAVAGCERPFAWCEIHHHRISWGRGGRTDLDNGLPLCAHHHRRAHDPRWELWRHPSGDHRFRLREEESSPRWPDLEAAVGPPTTLGS